MDETLTQVSFYGLKKSTKTLKQFIHIFFEDLESATFIHPKKKVEVFDRNFNSRMRPILMDKIAGDPMEYQIDGEMRGGRFQVAAGWMIFHLEPTLLEMDYREKFNDVLADNFPLQITGNSAIDFLNVKMVFLADQVKYKQWKNFSFPSVHEDRSQVDIYKIYNNIVINLRIKYDRRQIPETNGHRFLSEIFHPIRESLISSNHEFLELMVAYITSRSMFATFEPRTRFTKALKKILIT